MTQADSFSWDLPDDARIVALVHDSSERERSATVVDAIATAIGRHREHTLVMSTEPGPTPLDELVGAVESNGWPAFFADRERLTRVAVQRPESLYVYLPAGQDTETVTRFLLDDIFMRFLERVRERGGTLLLVISERTPMARDLGGQLDGYVALGDIRQVDSDEFDFYGRVRYEAEGPATADDAATPEEVGSGDDAEARVDTDAPADAPAPAVARAPDDADAPDEADSAEPEARSGPRPARRRLPTRLVVWLLVAAALLAGGGWGYRNPDRIRDLLDRVRSMVGTSDASAVVDPAPAVGEPAVSTRPSAVMTSADETPNGTPANVTAAPASSAAVPALDPARAGLAFETAPARPFSVLMGSLSGPAEAETRVAELRAAAPGLLYFTAPTPVEDVVYHRVFAGAFGSEAEAAAVLDELVQSGAAGEANPWHLRPAGLAYDLGVFTEHSEVEARIAELASRGISAYGLATTVEGRTVVRVYAGAYEDERSALPMAAILEAAGETATLTPRRGDATPMTPW
ncbi:SPOR domain-containing protein [Candidatus Palauibacter sp.]|uniref:SPOR domain-containing protein n=1 Tax=Candidatus Palauibacter sp. TaxID=3101350 RepID=UPI003B012899